MLRHIPNFLTCCNLLCGAAGILYMLEIYPWQGNNISYLSPGFHPAYFVWAACIFDFLDGFAARMLKVSSPIGKELDSLADVISFGLFPSVFMYKWIGLQAGSYLPFIALMIVVFSALRLAKFNIDETQHDSFKGLPTPANALFLTSLPFVNFESLQFLFSPAGLAVICVIFSLLLVSGIDLFALKFKDFTWKSNKVRFTFLVLSVLLLATLNFAAVPFIIILYILLSLGIAVIPGVNN